MMPFFIRKFRAWCDPSARETGIWKDFPGPISGFPFDRYMTEQSVQVSLPIKDGYATRKIGLASQSWFPDRISRRIPIRIHLTYQAGTGTALLVQVLDDTMLSAEYKHRYQIELLTGIGFRTHARNGAVWQHVIDTPAFDQFLRDSKIPIALYHFKVCSGFPG